MAKSLLIELVRVTDDICLRLSAFVVGKLRHVLPLLLHVYGSFTTAESISPHGHDEAVYR